MPCAAGVDSRHDGAKAEKPVGPGADMAAISEAGVVVFAPLISMPEIDRCSAQRAAVFRQHKARKFELTAASARLAQVIRSGDLGLKNGPSVCRAVGSSPSRQEGVAASSRVSTVSAQDNSHPAASMPVLSRKPRRVGFDRLILRIVRLLIDQDSGS